MGYEIIVASIKRALDTSFDRELAITRLKGAMSSMPQSTLHIKKERKAYRFYEVIDGAEDYMNKSDKRLYPLARKRYCKLLIQLLNASPEQRDKCLVDLRDLLMKFEKGGLELERIVLTQKQYRWYRGRFVQKAQGDASHPLEDYFVRSKSEQTTGRTLIRFGVPFHFEEKLVINVSGLVEKLRELLETEKFFNWEFSGKLYFMKGDEIVWLVPAELRWMNAPGSIWKTYDPKTGCITIYPDFKIMLADGTIVRWEHEGLTDNFIYRTNANERVSVMLITRTIEAENLIVTYEFDTDDEARLVRIIEDVILPRLWW